MNTWLNMNIINIYTWLEAGVVEDGNIPMFACPSHVAYVMDIKRDYLWLN